MTSPLIYLMQAAITSRYSLQLTIGFLSDERQHKTHSKLIGAHNSHGEDQ